MLHLLAQVPLMSQLFDWRLSFPLAYESDTLSRRNSQVSCSNVNHGHATHSTYLKRNSSSQMKAGRGSVNSRASDSYSHTHSHNSHSHNHAHTVIDPLTVSSHVVNTGPLLPGTKSFDRRDVNFQATGDRDSFHRQHSQDEKIHQIQMQHSHSHQNSNLNYGSTGVTQAVNDTEIDLNLTGRASVGDETPIQGVDDEISEDDGLDTLAEVDENDEDDPETTGDIHVRQRRLSCESQSQSQSFPVTGGMDVKMNSDPLNSSENLPLLLSLNKCGSETKLLLSQKRRSLMSNTKMSVRSYLEDSENVMMSKGEFADNDSDETVEDEELESMGRKLGKPKASNLTTIFVLSKSMVGPGIACIAQPFSKAGIITGLLAYWCCTLLFMFCVVLLIKARNRVKAATGISYSFGQLMELTGGSIGKHTFTFFLNFSELAFVAAAMVGTSESLAEAFKSKVDKQLGHAMFGWEKDEKKEEYSHFF